MQLDSKFALAPRGFGRSSFRFFEIFKLGTIPIYVWNDSNQVELEIISNERIAIHKNLTGFYIQGNKLLDTPFLKWYMNEFYSTNLDGKYTIHIIDTDINMLKLNSDEHIKLKEEKAYAVVSN